MCGQNDSDYKDSCGFGHPMAALNASTTSRPRPRRGVHLRRRSRDLPAPLGLDPTHARVNSVLVNCATTLLYQPDMVSLSHLNNYAHLEQAGDPRMVTYR